MSLKNRFGRDLLVEVYVREMLKLVLSKTQANTNTSLSRVYDRLETPLRALESLGVTTDMCAAMLYPLVESSLSEDLLRIWERNPKAVNATTSKQRLEELMLFLQAEVLSEERIAMAVSGFGLNDERAASSDKSKEKGKAKSKAIPTAAGLLSTKEDKHICIFCGQNHESASCGKAKKMSHEERQKIVKEKSACFHCLKTGHSFKFCRYKKKCARCGKRHVLLMCRNMSTSASSENSQPEESVKTQEQANFANISLTCEVFLQTIRVKLVNQGRERIIRAVFELAGLTVSDVDECTGIFSYEIALDRVKSSEGGSGWVNACALMHNKEMHAKNGNIDHPNDVASTRQAMVEPLRVLFWDAPAVTTHRQVSETVLLTDCENNLPRVFYSDSRYAGNTFLDNAGTIHQWVGRSDALLSCIANVIAGEEKKEVLRPSGEEKKEILPRTEETAAVAEVPKLRRPHAPALGSTGSVESTELTATPLIWAKGELERMCSEVRWVGVGVHPNYNHGCIVETNTAIKMVDAMTPNILNPQRGPQVSGYMAGVPVFESFVQSAESKRADWRELGIRVALYEDLRHNECVHPTGVNWAWPERRVPEKTIVPLTSLDMAHYEAVFVSGQALAASMRRHNESLMVGRPQIAVPWSVTNEKTRVVSLQDAGIAGEVGQDIWVLSHLAYPLAWVFDSYAIREGVAGQPTEELFIRTAGLVDIACEARRIIFVVPTEDRDIVRLGGRDFKIGKIDRHGNPDLNNPPVSYNIDVELEVMLKQVLTTSGSLRDAFNLYTQNIFVGGLNWLEIDSLVSALTVRWHPRVETYYDGEGSKRYRGAPANVLKTMYNGTPDKDGQTALRLGAYGGRVAVTSLDCVVSPRHRARAYPHIILGYWSNLAELTVGTGVCIYKMYNVENKADINSRLRTGLHDRLMRSRFLRKVVECWKRDAGFREEMAFPGQHALIRQYWHRWITEATCFGSLKYLAEYFITSTVDYSWDVHTTYVQGETLTGVRTPSSWWRNKVSTEWGGFSVGSTAGRIEGAAYELDNRSQSWFYGRWIQMGRGEVDVALESALNRLNLEDRQWDLGYRAHPFGEEARRVSWLVETNRTAMVAKAAGWDHQTGELENPLVWGWGVASMVRDWNAANLLTLTVPTHVAMVIEASTYSAGTWLSRGARESYAGPRLLMDYVGREPLRLLEETRKRKEPIERAVLNATALEVTPDAPAQLALEDLHKKIQELTAAFKVDHRID